MQHIHVNDMTKPWQHQGRALNTPLGSHRLRRHVNRRVAPHGLSRCAQRPDAGLTDAGEPDWPAMRAQRPRGKQTRAQALAEVSRGLQAFRSALRY